MKSFYVFHHGVQPGCARHNLAYLFGTFAEVKLVIDIFLWEEWSDFRQEIQFLTYIRGEKKQDIDLLPYLIGEGPGGVTFGFNQKLEPVGAPTGVLQDEDFLHRVVYRIDWSRIPVLDLPEPLLEPGDRAELEHLYADDPEDLEWGINDLEHGEAVGSDFLPGLTSSIAVKPDWLTSTVVALARSIDGGKDYAALPILADALQEAGCDHAFFLHHCRQPLAVHAHGSWLPKLLVSAAEGKRLWLT